MAIQGFELGKPSKVNCDPELMVATLSEIGVIRDKDELLESIRAYYDELGKLGLSGDAVPFFANRTSALGLMVNALSKRYSNDNKGFNPVDPTKAWDPLLLTITQPEQVDPQIRIGVALHNPQSDNHDPRLWFSGKPFDQDANKVYCKGMHRSTQVEEISRISEAYRTHYPEYDFGALGALQVVYLCLEASVANKEMPFELEFFRDPNVTEDTDKSSFGYVNSKDGRLILGSACGFPFTNFGVGLGAVKIES